MPKVKMPSNQGRRIMLDPIKDYSLLAMLPEDFGKFSHLTFDIGHKNAYRTLNIPLNKSIYPPEAINPSESYKI